jgi:cell division GTPase FtsZ
MKNNMAKINRSVVEPFYDLLCAGEEKKPDYIGTKIVDAGDIIQTLVGWTVIGHGTSSLPHRFNFPFFGKHDFRNKVSETDKGVQAMQGAISELSLKCSPTDAKRALYLVSGPPNQINMDMVRGLGSFTKTIASEAIIRSGDYPRGNNSINVTVILSELANVTKVMEYFSKTIRYIDAAKKKWVGAEYEQRAIEDIFKDIPSLLS